MKLYSPPDNHKLAKILFASRLFGKPVVHEPVPYSHKNKQFSEHNALFSIPALETAEGEFVFGVHSILRYLAPAATTPFQQVCPFLLRHKSTNGYSWWSAISSRQSEY